MLALALVVLGMAIATAQWRVARGDADAATPKPVGEWTFRAGLPPALLIGSRLAVEPGHGTRAVPVRSALVGVIAGVIGVVGCFTFRAGLVDTANTPSRAGIVWDYLVAAEPGPLPSDVTATIKDDRDVGSAMRAQWARAISIDGAPTPTFGTSVVKGSMSLVVLQGHAPRSRGRDRVRARHPARAEGAHRRSRRPSGRPATAHAWSVPRSSRRRRTPTTTTARG